MNKQNIQIKIVNSWSEKDIVALYKAGGWWKDYYNPSGLKNLIKGSFAFAVAVEKVTNKDAVESLRKSGEWDLADFYSGLKKISPRRK